MGKGRGPELEAPAPFSPGAVSSRGEAVVRIGIIGGLDRSGPLFGQLAHAAGHEALFHDGGVGARGVRGLEWLVEHADLVVILTDVNSHGAVRLARRMLRERGRSAVLLRRCGAARFAQLLAALGERHRLARERAA